ncbi:hypothetical protein [Sphaerisporangium sp. NPDC051011]|uniref:hypothetical protein n=1 Tax=Sphaerisporangium sp. NPDC051011 TaxID=3155792 RepID=UPI0033CDE36B
MRVRMKAKISGTRDGKDWPDPEGEIDLPEDEAAQLCNIGMAVPVDEEPAAPVDEEPDEEPAAPEPAAAPQPDKPRRARSRPPQAE